MSGSSARTTAQHLHLVRAAQSAGEAFACPTAEPETAASLLERLGIGSVMWVSLALIAAVALAISF